MVVNDIALKETENAMNMLKNKVSDRHDGINNKFKKLSLHRIPLKNLQPVQSRR